MKFALRTILSWTLVLTNVSMKAQSPAQSVPDFNFSRLNKNAFTNKDLATGKMLFFVFFDADCDHCQHAMQYISKHYSEFKKTAIYLITLDSQEKINGFMSKYGNGLLDKKNVTILQDPKYEFINKFKPRKYPSLFLYSADMKLMLYEDNEKNLSWFSKQISGAAK